MITAPLLSMFVVPVVYLMFRRRRGSPGMTLCWWSPMKLRISLLSQTIRATGCYIVMWPITRRAVLWLWSVSA